MEYKVGDKVRIKSLDWYKKAPKDIFGYICEVPGPFVQDMSNYCGRVATIIETEGSLFYRLDIDNKTWAWSKETFEYKIYKDMKKSDLKPGMVIETREGNKALVIEVNGKLYYTKWRMHNNISKYYNEDLTNKFSDLDIDKVYKISQPSPLSTLLDDTDLNLTLLWERPKEVELTMDEIAKKFGIEVAQLKIKK